jgi:RNA polymerase sigma-70 factor (ECF subfamily)
MPEPELDEHTLRLAAGGDPVAARRLVERYQRMVFALAARVLGRGSPDVADTAQETFLRVFAALATFDTQRDARVSTWIATITTRVAIDAARRRRPVIPIERARDYADASLRDPGEQLDEVRRDARLAIAMERLAPDQRAAMVLRIEHEMSLEDIARALRIEVGTVKSRLARARAALLAAVNTQGEQARDGHA